MSSTFPNAAPCSNDRTVISRMSVRAARDLNSSIH